MAEKRRGPYKRWINPADERELPRTTKWRRTYEGDQLQGESQCQDDHDELLGRQGTEAEVNVNTIDREHIINEVNDHALINAAGDDESSTDSDSGEGVTSFDPALEPSPLPNIFIPNVQDEDMHGDGHVVDNRADQVQRMTNRHLEH